MKFTRIMALFLTLCLTLSCLPMTARADDTILASGSCGEASWMVDSGGTLTIYGVGSMYGYNDGVSQPWHGYKDQIKAVLIAYGVTNIGQFAFSGCYAMESVSIPDSVTSIGNGAFSNCGKLTSVQLPSGISSIPAYTFEGCSALAEVTLPDGLELIGRNAFNSCYSLKTIAFPQSLKYIDEKAFSMCQGLESVIFTGDAPRDPASPFYGVETSIHYPVFNATWSDEAMSAIAENSFGITWVPLDQAGNPYKPGYAVVDHGVEVSGTAWVLTSDGTLVLYNPGNALVYTHKIWQDYSSMIKSVTILDGVETIRSYAFSLCANLTSISIPNSVTVIEDSAFWSCSSLTELTIPASVESLGMRVFQFCDALEYVYFEGDAPEMASDLFSGITTTCVYPAGNPTWTEDVMQNYSGNITWVPSNEVHIHEYVETVVEPTCNADGCRTRTCTICGVSRVIETLPALGHDYVLTETIAATCEESGYSTYTCTRCAMSYLSDWISATGHTYTEEVIPATCQQGGCTLYTCTACGHTYTENETDALEHEYESVTREATCTEGGYTTYTCTVCGYSYTTDYTNALHHDYISERFEATCTEDGRIVYTCSRCGDIYESVFMLALGHYYESVVTPPSIGQQGYTTYTCIRCGDSYQDDFTDALLEYHILEGNNSQWTDTENGVLTFRTDGKTSDFVEVRVDGITAYNDEYTISGDYAVVTLNQYFFSRMSEGEHTLEIVFTDGIAIGTFTVIRTPEEERWLTWVFSEDGTLTVSGRGDMNIHFEAPWVEYKDRITNVVIEEGITTITSAAFMEYPNLATISIPDSVQYIEDHSFYQCPSLTSIVIPDGVTEIGMGTFCGCTSLKSIQIPDSVQTLGYYAFMDCSSLTEIRIPEGVTYIDEMLFWGCHSLTTVHMPGTITEIRDCAFTSCYALTDISIPHGVTSIGEMAFSGCTVLNNLVFPSTVTYIGEDAFSACYGLNTITFRGDAPTFDGSNIFYLVFATACYPKDNPTWTAAVRTSYGGSIVWQAIAPCEAGHSYSAVVTEATCTEGGSAIYTCTVCGDTYTEYTDPLGHSYETVVTAPTCTEGGCTTHTCAACGDTYTEYTEPTGHDYQSVVTEPTFDSEGYTTHTCRNCGDSYVTDYVPALIRYEILEGDNGYWSDEENTDLVFRADGEIDSFTAVRIDGATVDPSRYTVTEGSTVVTLRADFLLRLPSGEHTLEIVFADGIAIATFTVEKFHILPGDLTGDGEVDIFDANLIVAYYNGTADLTAEQQTAADVNGDGDIDIFDANLVVSYYNGTIAAFPVEE